MRTLRKFTAWPANWRWRNESHRACFHHHNIAGARRLRRIANASGQRDTGRIARESGYNLCRAALSRHSNQAIESEIVARSLDCGPYAASIAQREAAADAVVNNFANSMQPNRPVTTYCNPIGNGMNCRSY